MLNKLRGINRIPLSSWILILAIIIGTFVRIWKIDSLPFPPNGDELAFAYYGWSLLNFQIDEYGRFLPFNFPSIGDFKYPGLAYLNILPAALFGLSELTARFWSVFSGVLLIPLIYFLSMKIFQNKITAFVSAWLVALSPWSITLSRIGYENHISITLTTAGLTLLLHIKEGMKKQLKNIFLFVSFTLFLISSFCYGAQRLFIPAILIFLFILSFIKGSELSFLRKPLLILFLILSTVIGISLIPVENRGRASSIAWRIGPDEENRLQELIIEAGISPTKVPVLITHIFHNRTKINIESFVQRYINHFSPKFLLFEGEASVERIPDIGMLLLIEVIFLFVGFLTVMSIPNRSLSLFVLGWLLIAPLPSALTFGEPHINRASIMIPPLILISGHGFLKLSYALKRNYRGIVIVILFVALLLNGAYALNQIFVHKPVSKPWFSEQVNKQLVEEIYKIKDNYKAVAISKDEYIYFLFYKKITPFYFLKSSDIKPISEGSWDRVKRFENIHFNMSFNCPKSGKLNTLYVCRGIEVPQNAKIITLIRYLDSVPAYTFIEFFPISKMTQPLPKLPEGLHYMVAIESDPKYPDGIIPDDYPRLW